jgi:hypothetical protein
MTQLTPVLPDLYRLQYATEKWYIDEGYLFSKFHKVYWMGLNTEEQYWPQFFWNNPLRAGPSASDYNNWGTLT